WNKEATLTVGSNTIYAKATDTSGRTTETSIIVTYNSPDTACPTISITSPSDGASFTSPTISVSGTASDNAAVAQVEVKVGNGDWQLATGTTSWSKDVTLIDGSNTIYARATDTTGNFAQTPITVTYNSPDTTDPVISITSPSDGASFTSPNITVSGTASDNAAVAKVEVKVGSGAWQLASGITSWSKDVTLASGSNIIYAKASDNSGRTKETSITVTYSAIVQGLSGKVINSVTGAGIADATVKAGSLSVTSQPDGSYVIPNITHGTYTITTSRSGFRTRTFNSYPIPENPAIVQNIALTPDYVDVGVIRGYVVNALNGNELNGVRVEIGDGMVAHSSSSYQISDVPVGTSYTLTATPYSGYIGRSIGKVRAGQGVGFSPPMSTSDTIIDFALAPEWVEVGSISGRVTNVSTGNGISGARVNAGFGQVAVTGDDGSYTLENLPYGTYNLVDYGVYNIQVYCTGYEASTAQVTLTGASTQNFNLKPNNSAGWLYGRVTSITTNNSINGALVSVGGKTVMAQRQPGGYADSYYTGYYYVYGINPGQYTLAASSGGFSSRSRNDVQASAQSSSCFNIALTPDGAPVVSLTGIVKNSLNGSVIGSANVSLTDGIALQADAGGLFTFNNLPLNKTFNLSASRSGYRSRTINNMPTGTLEGATIAQNIALTPDYVDVGTIRGYVVNALTGDGLNGVRVEIGDGMVTHSYPYNNNGTYQISDVPVGRSYTLTATPYSGYIGRSIGKIRAGQGVGFSPPMSTSDTIIDFALAPEWVDVGSISGRVTNVSTGNGIAGARVNAGFGQVAVTGDDGSYTLENLPYGTYNLVNYGIYNIQTYCTGYEAATAQVTLTGASTQNFNLKPNNSAGWLYGRVTSLTTNNSINGAMVSVGGKTVMAQRMPGSYSSSEIYYYVYGINPGQYQILAVHPSYVPAVSEATVSALAGSQKDFQMQLRTGNPVAGITWPQSDQEITGTVTVMGMAYDDDLASYKLEYSASATPQDWHLIAQATQSVITGQLAQWDTTGLAAGTYNLRLTVRDQSAHEANDSVQVNVTGTPAVLTPVSISPASKTVATEQTFTVALVVHPVAPIAGVQFNLTFDPSLLTVVGIQEGTLLSQGGAVTYFTAGTIDNAAGTVSGVAGAITTPGATVSAEGTFAIITLKAKGIIGTSALALLNVVVGDIDGSGMPVAASNGSITITAYPDWDVSCDGHVNVLDMIRIGQHWGQQGEAHWIREDVKKDGLINILDMILIGQHWTG
ncbi:MAG: carboxypeptidase regulatory-like domain-containing protein, partial [Dehalococcoidia bacterium]